MDHATMLNWVRCAIKDVKNENHSRAVLTNTLHALENRLLYDMRAEESDTLILKDANGTHTLTRTDEAGPPKSPSLFLDAILAAEDADPVGWQAVAARRKATCKRLRAERDAAREYIDRTDQEHKNLIVAHDTLKKHYESQTDAYNERVASRDALQREMIELRLDLDEHKKWNVDYEQAVATLQAELDAQVESCDRTCDQRNAIRNERDELRAKFADVVASRDAIQGELGRSYARLNVACETLKNVTADRDGTDKLLHDAVLQRDNLRAELDQIRTAVVERGRPASDLSNLVSENAGLRVQLKSVGKQLDIALSREKDERERRLCLLAENEALESDLRKCQVERAEALIRIAGLAGVNTRLNEDLQQVCDENDTLKAELSAAAAGKAASDHHYETADRHFDIVFAKAKKLKTEMSDRLAALEDHVELMGAQFETFCKTVDERFCHANDRSVERIHAIHKRIDGLKHI